MYEVVGCPSCRALWIVADQPETTGCPRCGARHRLERLRSFHETPDQNEAKQVRAAFLATRSGHETAFESLDSFSELAEQIRGPVVDDAEFFEEFGIDAEAVAAISDHGKTERRSRPEQVRMAITQLEEPTEDAIVAFATERGVPEAAVRKILDQLVNRGEATISEGHYRLV